MGVDPGKPLVVERSFRNSVKKCIEMFNRARELDCLARSIAVKCSIHLMRRCKFLNPMYKSGDEPEVLWRISRRAIFLFECRYLSKLKSIDLHVLRPHRERP